MAFDFPNTPTLGQLYTTPTGTTYTWNAYAWVKTGIGGTAADYVRKAGDNMAGFLALSADPTAPLHAASKAYVDAKIGLPSGGTPGEVLVKDLFNNPTWGAPIEGGSY